LRFLLSLEKQQIPDLKQNISIKIPPDYKRKSPLKLPNKNSHDFDFSEEAFMQKWLTQRSIDIKQKEYFTNFR